MDSEGQWAAQMEPIAQWNDHGNYTGVWVTQRWGGGGGEGGGVNELMHTTVLLLF